jgi:ribosome-associated translation inhibitor RaiA
MAEKPHKYCVKSFQTRNLHPSTKPCKMHRKCNARSFAMKTATIPALRVDPALREAAEKVLQDGETISSFVEQSIRAQIAQRQAQHEFVARGVIARDTARQSGVYVAADDVMMGLEKMLARAKSKSGKTPPHPSPADAGEGASRTRAPRKAPFRRV